MSSVALNGEPSEEVDKSELMKNTMTLKRSDTELIIPIPNVELRCRVRFTRVSDCSPKEGSDQDELIKDIEAFGLGRHE